MSITSYTELQSAITRWIARDDMASNIPDWITAFEQAATRRLRVREMEAGITLSMSAGFHVLPTDYLEWREIRALTSSNTNVILEYITSEVFYSTYSTITDGTPRSFTLHGGIQVAPVDDSINIRLDYIQDIPPLVTSNTNWLLTKHPDAYLFGSLYHAYDFMLDLQNAAFRKSQRDEILDEIQTLSNKSRGVGGMRVLGPTP